MGDVIQLDEDRRRAPIKDKPVLVGMEPVCYGQRVDVEFHNSMEVVFVNGVPWSYDVLNQLADNFKRFLGLFKARRLDDRGRIVREVVGPGGNVARFSRDIGLDGQVEPMPGAPLTEPESMMDQ